MPIIDFHTHSFPDTLAGKALDKLSRSAHITASTDGTVSGLRASMREAGISLSVLLPVVTNPAHTDTINRLARLTSESDENPRVLSFAGIHPGCDHAEDILENIAASGFKGIKLHPVFQGVAIDDERSLRVIRKASELGLIITVHAGEDISFPGIDLASVSRLKRMIGIVHPSRLVLAHMGGWNEWESVESLLLDEDIYLDTSFTMLPTDTMTPERFCRIVRRIGADRVLFGTDSPWSDQAQALRLVRDSGLTDAELNAVLYGNAARLLQTENTSR